MSLLIAIDRSLPTSVDVFVRSWNSDPDAVRIAVASPGPAIGDLSIDIIDAVLVTLSSISTGLATNLLYDLIKKKLGVGGTESIKLEVEQAPDGTTIVRALPGSR